MQPHNNVFVGNLAWATSSNRLREHFGQVSAVIDAEIQYGRDGRSRGFGVVEFDSNQAALAAISKFNETDLDGRIIFVREDRGTRSPKPVVRVAAPKVSMSRSSAAVAGSTASGGRVHPSPLMLAPTTHIESVSPGSARSARLATPIVPAPAHARPLSPSMQSARVRSANSPSVAPSTSSPEGIQRLRRELQAERDRYTAFVNKTSTEKAKATASDDSAEVLQLRSELARAVLGNMNNPDFREPSMRMASPAAAAGTAFCSKAHVPCSHLQLTSNPLTPRQFFPKLRVCAKSPQSPTRRSKSCARAPHLQPLHLQPLPFTATSAPPISDNNPNKRVPTP